MLRLLIDEDVHGDIVDGLRRRQPALDLVRVQDVGLGHTPDSIILEWAAQQGRVVVSVDKKTLAVDAWDRVARGLRDDVPDAPALHQKHWDCMHCTR